MELQFILLICTAHLFWRKSSARAPACLMTGCATSQCTKVKFFRCYIWSYMVISVCPPLVLPLFLSFWPYQVLSIFSCHFKLQTKLKMLFVVGLPVCLRLVKEGIFTRSEHIFSTSGPAVRQVWIWASLLLSLYSFVWIANTFIPCASKWLSSKAIKNRPVLWFFGNFKSGP